MIKRSVYILLMTSQSIANDVAMARQLWRNRVNNDVQFVRYRFYSRQHSWMCCKKGKCIAWIYIRPSAMAISTHIVTITYMNLHWAPYISRYNYTISQSLPPFCFFVISEFIVSQRQCPMYMKIYNFNVLFNHNNNASYCIQCTITVYIA